MVRKIFLSHSSQDGDFARLLADEIERFLGSEFRVFVSSRSDAIPSGRKWREQLVESLRECEAFVALVTLSSVKSEWVPWELGYFEAIHSPNTIYLLASEGIDPPSPMKEIQAKAITERYELLTFFTVLARDLDTDPEVEPEIDFLVEEAVLLGSKPPERSVEQFFSLVEKSEWERVSTNGLLTYVCQDDMLFQIKVKPNGNNARLKDVWAPGLVKAKVWPHSVEPMIAGQVVAHYEFAELEVEGMTYFVPVPRMRNVGVEYVQIGFVWVKNSPEFKLLRVVGSYGMHQTFDKLAQTMGMKLVDT